MSTLTRLEERMYRPFGRTKLRASPLGFGGAPIGVLDAAADEAGRVLNSLLDAGVNLFDTAACYYGSEELIGRTIAARRDEFILVTKCGHAMAGGSSDKDFTPQTIARNIDTSLKRLRTDRLDVVLLHSCSLEILKQGDALAAAIEAREAGKVRFVGYSGDNEAAEYAAGLDDVAVIQTSVSICDQANIDRGVAAARATNIGVMAKRPIANAAWKALDEQYERYRNYAKPYHERFRAMNLALEDFDVESWPELFLRFTLSTEGVHVAIVGTTDPEHVEANLRIAAKDPLPDEALVRIRRAFADADENDDWVGLT